MLQVNFIMICIIHKISVLFKITRILKTLFKECNKLLFFKKKIFFFSSHLMIKSPSLKEESIIKDVRNVFRLEKLKTRNN